MIFSGVVYPSIKRIFDFIFAFVALILFSPLIIIVSILILVFQGPTILFIQERPGLNKKPFKIFKFCTMTFKKDNLGNLLPDKKRITRLGNFLRVSSIDELPSLINIIKGDMSFIGPRPLLTSYLKLYSKEQAIRHEVRPGFSGLSQINGRNSITWEEKFSYDIKYVKERNLCLDLKILFITIFKVLRRDGIYTKDGSEMPLFTGSKNKSKH